MAAVKTKPIEARTRLFFAGADKVVFKAFSFQGVKNGLHFFGGQVFYDYANDSAARCLVSQMFYSGGLSVRGKN